MGTLGLSHQKMTQPSPSGSVVGARDKHGLGEAAPLLVLPRAALVNREPVVPVVLPHLSSPPGCFGEFGSRGATRKPGRLVGHVLPVLGAFLRSSSELTLKGMLDMMIQFSVAHASCTIVGSSSWSQNSFETFPSGSNVHTQMSGVPRPFALKPQVTSSFAYAVDLGVAP